MWHKRFTSRVAAGVVVFLALAAGPLAAPTIVPKHFALHFLPELDAGDYTEYIVASTGVKIYVISLEPERDTRGRVAGVDLVLQDVKSSGRESNLLSPKGNWHGLQPYDFVAADLAQGAAKSAFGARRSIAMKQRGIVVRMSISRAEVSSVPGGSYELKRLDLIVSVENL